MKRLLAVLGSTLIALGVSALFVGAQVSHVPSGKWAPASPMLTARVGASAAQLSDGRILITGGATGDFDNASALATAELLESNGTFRFISPMLTARARHASVRLKDERVLVTGGVTADGTDTTNAEIYDPGTDTWSSAGDMLEARSGHTMSALKDGRVLIVGGATAELYDPATGVFSFAGALSPARTHHAAAVLQDGRVVIAGGEGSDGALTAIEIYEDGVGVTALGELSIARAALSATTLLDGRVLFAGGRNASGDLASMEVYDPRTGVVSVSTGTLNVARSSHQAFLLPSNNHVLFVGGTSSGATLSSAELYAPWSDATSVTGSMASARAGAVGSPLVQDGLLVVAGGSNASGFQSSAELYGFPTIRTDKDDYAPGTPVVIFGSGWKPGETVHLALKEFPPVDEHDLSDVVADDNGDILTADFAPDDNDLNIRFYLTARGETSGLDAQNTFTDAAVNKIPSVGPQTPSPVVAGNPATYSVTVAFNGNSTTCSAVLSVSGLPPGTAASFVPVPAGNPANTISSNGADVLTTLTVSTTAGMTPVSTHLTINASGTGTCSSSNASTNPSGTGGNAANPALDISKANQSIAFAALPSKTYGDSDFTVSAAASSGLVVSFSSLTAPVCTVSGTTVHLIATGSCSIRASQTGNANYNAAPNVDQSFTISPATLTYTASSKTRTYGAADPSFTGTVTGFVNGDTQASATTGTLSFTTPATPTGPVGSYAINGGGLSAANYSFVQAPTNATALTITAATLTYTADPKTRTYGAADPIFTGTVTGFVNGQTQSTATTGTLSFTTPATSTSPVGTYAINGTGLSATNYVFAQAPTNATAFTITAATLNITATDDSKSYGQTRAYGAGSLAFGASGLQNGETIGSVTITASGGTGSTAPVGTYSLTPSAATGGTFTAGNYDIHYLAGTLTVTKATFNYAIGTASHAYGSTVDLATALGTTIATGINGEHLAITYSSTGNTVTALVGSYAITGVVSDGTGLASNYTAVLTNGTLTVDPAPLSITAGNLHKTYGATQTFAGTEFSASGLVNSDTVASVMLTSAGAAGTAGVGPYSIVASAAVGTGLSNYTITYHDGTLTVDPAPLSITAGSLHKTYGATQTFAGTEFSVSGLVNSDTVASVMLTSAGAPAITGVGTYPIVASAAVGTALGNYTITYHDGTLTVDPAPLSITASSLHKTYGATHLFSGSEFTTSGLLNSDAVSSVTLTSAGAVGSAAVGPYSIVASAAVGTGLGNYTITYHDGTLTVDPAPLSITASSLHKTYGATQTFAGTEFTATGLVNSDTVASVTLTSAGAPAVTGVGAYPIVASAAVGTGLGNYTITYHDGTLTVDPAPLSITAGSLHKTYGATQTFTGTEFSATGLVNSDTVASVMLTSAGAPAITGVGTYPIAASAAVGTGLSNYTITYHDGTLTVDPAPLSITAASTHKPYGATQTFAGTDFSASGLLNSDTVTSVTLTSAGAVGTAAVGPYSIVASVAVGTGLGNYTIAYHDGTLTVDPAPLSITAASLHKTYGATHLFSGSEFTTSGLVNSDAVTSVTLTSAGAVGSAAVGPYSIVASAAVGTGLSNYTITYHDGALTVDPAPLSITAASTHKTYGATQTFAGTEFSATGLVSSDTVASVTLTSVGAVASTGVGTYPIVASAAVGTGLGNYTITYHDGTLTVDPAPLSITASSLHKTYGATHLFSGIEFTTSGLVNSDAVTSVTLTSAGAAGTAAVGPYSIVASAAVGSGLSNYTITYHDGTLTVDPASLSITAASTHKPYGATQTFTGTEFSASGLVNSDAVTSVTLTSTGAVSTAGVGPYSIVASAAVGTGLGNYTITYHDGTLAVDPAPLSITAGSLHKTYGATQTFTGTEFGASGLVNSDAVTSVTLTSTGAVGTAGVGPYSIVASAAVGTGLSNYTITYHDGTLTVDPALLSITAASAHKPYGTTRAFIGTEFTSSGLLNSDAVTGVTLTSAGAVGTAAVGPYSIVASAAVGTGLGNYTITYHDGTLTVDPAPLTITAKSAPKPYGTTLTFSGTEFTTSGLVNADGVTSVTLTSAGAAGTAAVGPYAIVASAAVGTGLGNYTITYHDGTLTVNPAALTITANDAHKTYGTTATLAGTEFTVSGLVNSDAVTSVTLTSAGAVGTAAVGPYSIVASAAVGTGLINYTITYADGTLTVDRAPLTITATSFHKPYGTTRAFIGTEFTTSGLLNSDAVASVTLTSTGALGSAAVGPYSIVASAAVGSGLSNYTITYADGTLTVDPVPLTITATSFHKPYGSTRTFIGTEFTPSGLLNGDAVTSVTLTSAGAAATAGVGPFSIVASAAVGTGLGNYTITYTDGTLTVDPAALTIIATSFHKPYGTTRAFIGTEFTTSGLLNSDAVTSVTLTSAGAVGTAGVGPFSIVASDAVGTGLGNYTITYTDGTLTVDPAALTIIATSVHKPYGTAHAFIGTEFTPSGLLNSDAVASVTLTSTGAAATAGVGSYSIVASAAVGTGLGNYTITYTDGTLKVDSAALTITATSAPKPYGTTRTFSGTEFTASGLMNGDTVTSVTLASTGAVATAAVGPYPIVASAAIGTGLGNYTITYVDGTLTVGAVTLTITAANDSKSYGETRTYGAGSAAFTSSGLQNGETIGSVTITAGGGAAATDPVGSYSLTPSAAAGGTFTAGNYEIHYVAGTLAVTQAAISYTISGTSHPYGSPVNLATAFGTTIPTGINGENLAIAYNSTGNTATAGVGAYAITGVISSGTGLASNYTVTLTSGTLTVMTAPVSYTIANASHEYGSTVDLAATLGTTINTGINGQTLGITYSSTGNAATAPVGTYAIIGVISDGTGLASNYSVTLTNGTLTVIKAHLLVKADSKTKLLGAALPPFTATITGYKNGETLASSGVTGTPNFVTGATTASPIGIYTISPSLGTLSAANYQFVMPTDFVNSTLSIVYAAAGSCLGEAGHQILPPINADGTSLFKQRSTVPAKFRVCDATGHSIGTSDVVSSFRLVSTMSGTVSTTVNEIVDSTTPDTMFRWSSTDQQWIFNINTKGLAANLTYFYRVTLNDGSVVDFSFGLK